MRRASRGFHLSSCAMLPWMRPTRSGVPSRVSAPSAIRHAPHPPTPASTTAVAAMTAIRWRPRNSTAHASAALTNATSADNPYTPSTLASCATGRTVTWLLPSGTHGNPPKRYPRANSVATHAAGINSSAPVPARLTSRAVISAVKRGKQREIGGQQQHRQQRHRHRQPAELADDGAGPVDGADEIEQPRREAKVKARSGGCRLASAPR